MNQSIELTGVSPPTSSSPLISGIHSTRDANTQESLVRSFSLPLATEDANDYVRAHACVRRAAANEGKLVAVRQKSYGRIDLLQHLDGNAAEHGNAVKSAGAE